MKKYALKFACLMALLIVLCCSFAVEAEAEPQKAIFPAVGELPINQSAIGFVNDGYGGLTSLYSHTGRLGSVNGSALNDMRALDLDGAVKVYAPFDLKVVDIQANAGNVVIVESINEVQLAHDEGKSIIHMLLVHDNDISDLQEGEIISQGTLFYEGGTYGGKDKYGNDIYWGCHLHIEAALGSYPGSLALYYWDDIINKDGWKQGLYLRNGIDPTKYFFFDPSTKFLSTKYVFDGDPQQSPDNFNFTLWHNNMERLSNSDWIKLWHSLTPTGSIQSNNPTLRGFLQQSMVYSHAGCFLSTNENAVKNATINTAETNTLWLAYDKNLTANNNEFYYSASGEKYSDGFGIEGGLPDNKKYFYKFFAKLPDANTADSNGATVSYSDVQSFTFGTPETTLENYTAEWTSSSSDTVTTSNAAVNGTLNVTKTIYGVAHTIPSKIYCFMSTNQSAVQAATVNDPGETAFKSTTEIKSNTSGAADTLIYEFRFPQVTAFETTNQANPLIKAGTTYYYKWIAVIDGNEHPSNVSSFTTAYEPNWSQYNPNTDQLTSTSARMGERFRVGRNQTVGTVGCFLGTSYAAVNAATPSNYDNGTVWMVSEDASQFSTVAETNCKYVDIAYSTNGAVSTGQGFGIRELLPDTTYYLKFFGMVQGSQEVYPGQVHSFKTLGTVVPTYQLTVSVGAGGTVNTNASAAYASGTTISLTATPNTGYLFTGWTSSNGGSFAAPTSASTTFTMPANATTVTANFVAKNCAIAVSPSTIDFGSVVASDRWFAPKIITVTNTGNVAATVSVSASANVIVTGNSQTVAPGAQATFSVVPKDGINAGIYSEVLTISATAESGALSAQQSVALSFAVKKPVSITPSYGPVGFHDCEGYVDYYTLHHVLSIVNNGDESIQLGQPSITTDYFSVGRIPNEDTTVDSGIQASFSISCKMGLKAGTYRDRVSLPWNCGDQSGVITWDVEFVVEPRPVFIPEVVDFGTIEAGSTGISKKVIIKNTTARDIVVVPYNSQHFERGENDKYTEVPVGGELEFTVQFREPILPGSYDEKFEVSVFGGVSVHDLYVPVKAKVVPKAYQLLRTSAEVLDWGTLYVGDDPSVKSILVQNIGANLVTVYQPTGQYVDIGVMGGIQLNTNQSARWEVKPKKNLAPGIYHETIQINASNCEPVYVDIAFTIQQGDYSFSIDTAVLDFGYIYESDAYKSYMYPTKTFTVTNTGTETGSFEFTNLHDVDLIFGTTCYGKVTLKSGESIDISMHPICPLDVGVYEYDLKLEGENHTTSSIKVRFEVKPGDESSVYATPLSIDFNTVYHQHPVTESRQITIGNRSSSVVQLAQPVSQIAYVSALQKTQLAPGETTTITLTPRNDLSLGSHQETLNIRDVNGNVLSSVSLSSHVVEDAHKITLKNGKGYTLVVSDVAEYQDGFVPNGGSYTVSVDFHAHYRPGQQFAVKANGIPVEPSYTGWYVIYNITEDTVITVEGVEERPFTYPEDRTDPSSNVFSGTLNNPNDFLFGDLLEYEDEKKIDEAGAQYVVWLEVDDATYTTSSIEKHLIQSVQGDGIVTHYLDINLFKKIGTGNAEKVLETNGNVSITIEIPKGHRDAPELFYRNFGIIRVHDGVAEKLRGFYNPETGLLTFTTDCFSTYAVYYEDTPMDTGVAAGMNVPPKTGDDTPLLFYTFLMSASLMIGLWIKKGKKHSLN